MYGVKTWSPTRAAHVSSTDRNCMIFFSLFACQTRRGILSASLNKMPFVLQSATLLALSWPCHQCSHLNDLSCNKRRFSLCQSWRDGLAPLSAKGGGTSTLGAAACIVGLVNDNATPQLVYPPPSVVVMRQYFAKK